MWTWIDGELRYAGGHIFMYAVESCTLWSHVRCGVMYAVESCTLWSHVRCGVMYAVNAFLTGLINELFRRT
jgi:hypothetical protein